MRPPHVRCSLLPAEWDDRVVEESTTQASAAQASAAQASTAQSVPPMERQVSDPVINFEELQKRLDAERQAKSVPQ